MIDTPITDADEIRNLERQLAEAREKADGQLWEALATLDRKEES